MGVTSVAKLAVDAMDVQAIANTSEQMQLGDGSWAATQPRLFETEENIDLFLLGKGKGRLGFDTIATVLFCEVKALVRHRNQIIRVNGAIGIACRTKDR